MHTAEAEAWGLMEMNDEWMNVGAQESGKAGAMGQPG